MIYPLGIYNRNGIQVRLVSILEDYKISRRQKEEEKKRFRVIYLLLLYIILYLRFTMGFFLIRLNSK